uniref:Uncharacterized protein n=1 Tax=Sphaerodactylus townsendi TaxID=933632 RepID=A0ACB8END6_9SAUR
MLNSLSSEAASLANPPSPLIPSRQGCPTKGNFTSSLHRHYCLREWTNMDGACATQQQISHLVEKIVGVWRKQGSFQKAVRQQEDAINVKEGSSHCLIDNFKPRHGTR